MRRACAHIALAVLILTVASAQSEQASLAQANAALQAGQADRALAILASMPSSAESHNLRCRVFFTLEQWATAAEECEQAVRLDPNSSLDHMWLGRTLGEKAGRASFLSAYSLAKRVRGEFEIAVRLNPRSAEALADLGEFYYDAPGIVGGGEDKAYRIADQLDKVSPSRAYELRGRIAEKRKDFDTAEREFKQAVSVDPHPAFPWTTLASFYHRRSRWSDMDAALKNVLKASEHDHHAGVALYDGASVLIAAKRNPELAVRMLEEYIAEPFKSEEAPACAAFTRLARLKAQLGDLPEARRDRGEALKLAHAYQPALDLNL